MNKQQRLDFLLTCTEKQKRAYYDKVGRLFCLACGAMPPNLHHLVGHDWPKKKEYRPVVPLCKEHHQGNTGFHSGRMTFERRYLTQHDMFQQTEQLIERMEP